MLMEDGRGSHLCPCCDVDDLDIEDSLLNHLALRPGDDQPELPV